MAGGKWDSHIHPPPESASTGSTNLICSYHGPRPIRQEIEYFLNVITELNRSSAALERDMYSRSQLQIRFTPEFEQNVVNTTFVPTPEHVEHVAQLLPYHQNIHSLMMYFNYSRSKNVWDKNIRRRMRALVYELSHVLCASMNLFPHTRIEIPLLNYTRVHDAFLSRWQDLMYITKLNSLQNEYIENLEALLDSESL